MLPYVYRVTKYSPTDRNEHGHYVGSEDTASDRGPVEAAYLLAVEAFAVGTGVDRLAVREPQLPSLVHFGAEPPLDGFGLDGLFAADPTDPAHPTDPANPTGLPGPPGFHDGATVPLDTALELVRVMLRDGGAWCRLEAEGSFAVHVGWDQYLYVGSSLPCEEALARTRTLGLFPERIDASPYDMETDGEGIQRPGDDEFWLSVRRAVASHRAGLLEEAYVEGPARWHRLTPGTIATVRALLVPRARLAVWPGLSSDIDAVLAALPAEGLVECVWQDADGQLRSAMVDEDEFPELTARISGARAAALIPVYADECVPLFTAVVPDDDGVVRARWRTEPTPGDRTWAFLQSLRPGQVVTGTVTCIAEFWVTFVDIGGFEAMINIPELSWRPVSHPSDVVRVGQEISAEVLDIDLDRERVTLSRKALLEDPMPLLTRLIGTTVVGRVTKLVPFGTFVRIEDRANGFEGLVHHSDATDGADAADGHSDHHRPALAVEVGDPLPVKVLAVDPTRRRITLSHRQAVPGESFPDHPAS
ncbi:S1 RNA-binding domain-containing protein [Streptomyces sp. NPDC048442]|uniref:S1 RNA-binding domain-containing protein n=1 Tax=Streptomyces sp. NPDC048442 TaxID=3154823 RepID=UPI00342E96FF